jgi:hypothetical protein
MKLKKKKLDFVPELASELYRPSDCRLSAKLMQTFADRGCLVVSVTNPYGRILGFLDRNRYFFSKYFLSYTHEAEWIPMHFSENLVVLGIEPGSLDL